MIKFSASISARFSARNAYNLQVKMKILNFN